MKTLVALALLVLLGCGCSSAVIAAKEKMGIPKREQLVARVKDARDGQQDAKQQFASALDEFLAVTDARKDQSVAALEARYDKLKKEYERSESRAEDVHSRIDKVRAVAEALFKEWKSELAQYTNQDLRRRSEKELADTRAQYDKLMASMDGAAKKMDPVLGAFKDQVLFLKHNLNARAISSLQGDAAQIRTDINALIKDMDASIREANAFIDQMSKS
jgi:Skp family chaperone for outer membrane proteins